MQEGWWGREGAVAGVLDGRAEGQCIRVGHGRGGGCRVRMHHTPRVVHPCTKPPPPFMPSRGIDGESLPCRFWCLLTDLCFMCLAQTCAMSFILRSWLHLEAGAFAV